MCAVTLRVFTVFCISGTQNVSLLHCTGIFVEIFSSMTFVSLLRVQEEGTHFADYQVLGFGLCLILNQQNCFFFFLSDL